MKWALIFLAELVWSYFADSRNVAVISRKKWRTAVFDVGAAIIAWWIPWVVYVQERDWTLAIPAVVGGCVGSLIVAARKPRRKVKPKKRIETLTNV